MPSITSLISHLIRPTCAVWEITLQCNSKCIHCGSKAGKIRTDELDTEEALQLVRDIRDCGYKGVALMGGEPLIRDDWFEIAHEIKKNKLELSIVTNGLNVTDNLQKLKELKTDCVSLSLDGGTAKIHDYLRGVPGAFEKTLHAINCLKSEKLPVSVITSVSKTYNCTCNVQLKMVDISGGLFLQGIILFSGSLYIIVFTGMQWIEFLTPIGGFAFTFGWLGLMYVGFKSK